MRTALSCLCIAAALFPAGCNRDNHADARRLAEIASRYYERGELAQASIVFRRALQRDPKLGKAYYSLGLTELRLGNSQNALGSFFRAYELQDGSYDAYEPLAKMLVAAFKSGQGRTKERRVALNELNEKEIKKNPNSKHLPLIQGEMLLADGEAAGAVQMLETARQRNPEDPTINLPLFQALDASGKPKEAEALAREQITKHKNLEPMYSLLFDFLWRQKRWDDAEAIRKQLIEASPANVEARIALADFYLKRGRAAAARAYLDQSLAELKGGHLAIGDYYLRSIDPKRAAAVYEEGIARNPARREQFQTRIVDAKLQAGEIAASKKLVDEILAKNPNSPHGRAARGILRYETQPAAALDDLRFAVKTDASNGSFRIVLGLVEQAAGNAKDAEVQLSEAVRLMPLSLQAKMALANFYSANTKLGRAFAIAEEIIAASPSHVQARQLRASIWTEMKLYREARIDLDELLAADPANTVTASLRGQLALAERDYKTAEAIYLKLYRGSPENRGYLEGLLTSFVQSGRRQKADAFLRAEIAANPNRQELTARLSELALVSKDPAEAARQAARITETQPLNADAWALSGRARCHAGDFEKAEHDLRKAVNLDPEHLIANTYLGSLLAETGRFRDAIPYLERALPKAPEEPRILNDLAYSLAQTGGDLERAVTLAQKAVQRMPNQPTVNDTLGWVYLKRKLFAQAESVFRKNVDLEPANPTWRYHLALALIGAGKMEPARAELQAALKSKPPDREKREIEQLLARGGS